MGILSPDKQKKLTDEFEKWLDVAKAGPPKPTEILATDSAEDIDKKNAENAAKLAKFEANPGVRFLKEAQDAAAQAVSRMTGLDDKQKKEKFDEIVEFQIRKKRKAFLLGIEEGPEQKPKFETAFDHLMHGRIVPAIKEAIMAIPIVGMFMAAGTKSLKSVFSDKPINPITAFNELKEQQALQGAAAKLGITGEAAVNAFVSTAMSGSVEKPAAKPEDKPAPKDPKKTDGIPAPEITAEEKARRAATAIGGRAISVSGGIPVDGPKAPIIAAAPPPRAVAPKAP